MNVTKHAGINHQTPGGKPLCVGCGGGGGGGGNSPEGAGGGGAGGGQTGPGATSTAGTAGTANTGGGGGAGGFREGYNPGSYIASPLATTALPCGKRKLRA